MSSATHSITAAKNHDLGGSNRSKESPKTPALIGRTITDQEHLNSVAKDNNNIGPSEMPSATPGLRSKETATSDEWNEIEEAEVHYGNIYVSDPTFIL